MRRLQLLFASVQPSDLCAALLVRRLEFALPRPHALDLPLAIPNLAARRLAGQHRLSPHPRHRSRQRIRVEFGRVLGEDPRLQRFEIAARGGRST